MLRQLREGLQLYGLIGVLEKNKAVCRGLFVAGDDDKVCPDLLNHSLTSSSLLLSLID